MLSVLAVLSHFEPNKAVFMRYAVFGVKVQSSKK